MPVVPEFIKRRSQVWPAPVLDGPLNLPLNWNPTSETVEDWGYYKLVQDGVDVTYYRDIPIVVESYSDAEPFGSETMSILFPQIHPMEALPVWMGINVEYISAELYVVHPNPDPDELVWEGFLISHEAFNDESSYGLRCHYMGALYQMDLYKARPPIVPRGVRDLGEAIAEHFDSDMYPALKVQPLASTPVIGINTNLEGSWNPVLTGHIMNFLSQSVFDDGSIHSNQWTIHRTDGRVPVLEQKDMTTQHWSVTCGAPGVEHSIEIDLSAGINTYFGEGLRPDACRWRNVREIPEFYDEPLFYPLAVVPWTSPIKSDDGGATWEVNPEFDPDRLRIERHENHGANVIFDDAVDNAAKTMTRTATPAYMGSITLRADPEEGHRFSIKAGENILFKNFRGSDRLFHIVHADTNPEDGTVSLSVDTRGRDYLTFAEIRERNEENEQPNWMRGRQNRNSQITEDRWATWDCEANSGVIEPVEIARGSWYVHKMAAAAGGSIVRTSVGNDSGAKFAVGIFDTEVTAAELNAIGNPLADQGEGNPPYWDQYDETLVIAWGEFEQAAGYSPGRESSEDPITGSLVDDASWYYESQEPPWLWVAIWVEGAGTTNINAEFRAGTFN